MSPSLHTAKPGSPRRGEARENAILDAALELVAETGYERVTVDAIAARARASKTTIYKRWPGKAELVADALRRRAQGAEPVAPDTGSLRSDLVAVVGQIAQTFTGDAGPSLLALLGPIRDDPTLRELVGGQVRERSHEVGRIVCERAAGRGEDVATDRAGLVLDLAFATLFTDALFASGRPGTVGDGSPHEKVVDDVLLPLLRRARM
jgi:AcrR family transcriptional regulator